MRSPSEQDGWINNQRTTWARSKTVAVVWMCFSGLWLAGCCLVALNATSAIDDAAYSAVERSNQVLLKSLAAVYVTADVLADLGLILIVLGLAAGWWFGRESLLWLYRELVRTHASLGYARTQHVLANSFFFSAALFVFFALLPESDFDLLAIIPGAVAVSSFTILARNLVRSFQDQRRMQRALEGRR